MMSTEILLHGLVDTQGPVIHGWAYDPQAADNKCCLEITVGDSVIYCYTGHVYRPDVAMHFGTPNAANSGFRIDLTTFYRSTPTRVIVRFKKTGDLVKNGDFLLYIQNEGLHVFEGIDGYLFYKGDKSEVIAHMTGEMKIADSAIISLSTRIATAAAVTEAYGGKHVFCIAPDKIAVHPLAFSVGFRPSVSRFSQRLVAIHNEYFRQQLLYPLSDLKKKLGITRSVTKTDSHLSWRAQFVVFEIIMKIAGHSRATRKLDVEWQSQSGLHDLAMASGSDVQESEEVPHIGGSDLRFFPVAGSDALICYNEKGSIPFTLLFGTSSCRQLTSLVAHVSKLSVHIWSGEPDIELIKDLKPSLVINYIPERALPLLENNFSKTGSHVRAKIMEAMRADGVIADITEAGKVDNAGLQFQPPLMVMSRPRRDRSRPWPIKKAR